MSWTEQSVDEAVDEIWAHLRERAPYTELAQTTVDSEIFEAMKAGMKDSLWVINTRNPDDDEVSAWLYVLFVTTLYAHSYVADRWARIAESQRWGIQEAIRKAIEDDEPENS